MKTIRPPIIAWSASLALAGFAACSAAAAQDAPKPKSTAQIDAGEPRAATSATAPPADAPPGGPDAAPAPAAGAHPAKAPAAVAPSATPPSEDAAGAKRAARAPGAADRVDLGTATVTGDREQPKVMYIVPWKSADIGELSGKPMNSLIDEALAPVDRDEFKREVVYYDVMKADKSRAGAAAAAPAQGEK